MSSTIRIELDNEIVDRLQVLAKAKSRSIEWLIEAALHQFLDRQERYELEKHEDAVRWRQFQETGEFVSDEDMQIWFDELLGAHFQYENRE